MPDSITFEVTGEQRLACEGCERRVERLLGALGGVDRVRAHAGNQRIEVVFEPGRLAASAIAEALKSAGYETKVVG